MEIPYILENGNRHEDGSEVNYTATINGIDYTVGFKKGNGKENFTTFYTNRDAIQVNNRLSNTQLSAQTDPSASRNANVANNSETRQESAEENEGNGMKYSLRTKPDPKKKLKVYKLMRMDEEGNLYPLFIGSNNIIELGKWYDADSPKLKDLKSLSCDDYRGKVNKKDARYGVHLIDNNTGEAISFEQYKADRKNEGLELGTVGRKNPCIADVNWATEHNCRFIQIAEYLDEKAIKKAMGRYGNTDTRLYYNYGIDGTGKVSTFAMRPGWHAGSLPTMLQIGKGPGGKLRDKRFVWVEGEVPADIDYNEEAMRNKDKDIPDHIPTDGFYMKATNANAVKSQADLVGWYVAGAFKGNRVISDNEARSIIDNFNREHGMDGNRKVLYDYDREGGVPFSEEDARRINEKNGVKASLRNGTFIRSGSYFSGGGLLEEGLKKYLDPKVAVEFSQKISGVYSDNFGHHIVTADVRNVDPRELTRHIDGPVDYFHASPVCKNFSKAKRDAGEVELDRETAQSTADFIRENHPKVVTIENVKGYRGSEALKIITDTLTQMGYDWDANVYNAADYGGFTRRERLIVRAVRDGVLPPVPKKLPESQRPKGWMDAVEDLIPTLPEKKSGVPKWMDDRLKAEGIDWRHIDKPLYVFGQGNTATSVPHAFADELLPTLRTKGGDVIIMPDGRVLRATPRVLARVTGLADDYRMPVTDNMAHTIIGNGIPTQMSESVIGPLLEDVFNEGEKATDESLIEQRRQGLAPSTGVNQFETAEEREEREGVKESKRSVTPEMDKAYMDAVERGDMETAQKMVNEAADKAGYANDDSWKMSHEAPNSKDDFSVSMDDVSEMFPDMYGADAFRYYGDMGTGAYESISAIRSVKGNPDAMVTIYRAVPKTVKEGKVRNGDWVTLSEDYAREHGITNLNGYRIIKEEVPAKYLYTDGNSVNEFGYDDGSGYVYSNTKNNRKLADPVTYDDNGNVIPLSQRFNTRKDDVRYSKRSEESEEEMRIIIENAKKDGTYMLAPNGKNTNLNERQWAQVRTKNFKDWFGDWENDPENASKVVDENGEPMVVHHVGEFSTENYDEDETAEMEGGWFSSDKEGNEETWEGETSISAFLDFRNPITVDFEGCFYDNTDVPKGFWVDGEFWRFDLGEMYSSIKAAKGAEHLVSLSDFRDLYKAEYKNRKEEYDDVEPEAECYITDDFVDEIPMETNADGVILKRVAMTADNYIPLKFGSQVKSATDNNGEFSKDNNDVRHSKRTSEGADVEKADNPQIRNCHHEVPLP